MLDRAEHVSRSRGPAPRCVGRGGDVRGRKRSVGVCRFPRVGPARAGAGAGPTAPIADMCAGMTVLGRLRLDLTERRQAGEPFDDAWQAAVDAVRGRESDAWREALQSTRAAWLRAYEGRALPPRERALMVVGAGEYGEFRDLAIDVCARCHEPLPENRPRRGRALYCSRACQRAANGR